MSEPKSLWAQHIEDACPEGPFPPEESTRHPKWKAVPPGTVIPAGQPYRVEFDGPGIVAHECILAAEHTADARYGPWFIDSSWKPPLVLPTAPGSVVKATRGNKRRLWMRGGLNSWIGENGEGPASDSDLLDVRVLFDAESER